MLVIRPDEFDTYTNNYEDNDLKEYYCSAAQSKVEEYIGYSLAAADYTEKVKGYPIKLGAMPVNSIDELKINDEVIDSSLYSISKNKVVLDDSVVITKRSVSEISYNAGYDTITETIDEVDITTLDVPSVIKVVVLKIASLLMLEEGGNIGVTGVSTPDGMGRTFLNYTNYSKHLQMLNNYKIVRF